MGLDMYAARRTYVKQWDHQSPDEKYTVKVERGGKPVPGIKPERISYIEEKVMYWRKANHIHAWFVDNVQDGVDNCASYYVHNTKLRELLSICEEVIKASKLVKGQVIQSYTFNASQERVNHLVPGKVIEDVTVAKRLLPAREGFFFGGTEYDEEYLNDVVETRDWLIQTLKDYENKVPGDIYYSSWW